MNSKRLVDLVVVIAIILAIILVCFSCTENTRARMCGGTATIKVKKGYKVTEATWRDGGNIWYLIEPMDSGYQPKVKEFVEDSKLSIMEGKVIFVEEK